MEDQTIHDIEKTEKVVPRYSDCLIDLDSSSLIDLPVQVEHDVQNDFQVPDDTDVPLQDESHDQLPVPEISPDVPPRRSTRDRHPSTRDTLNDKLLTLEKIHTDDNGSDMLTKALTREKLETCVPEADSTMVGNSMVPWKDGRSSRLESGGSTNPLSISTGILQGLTYLHSCKVVHGDLKCANILVTESGRIKLADFGLSKSMEDHSQSLKLGLGSSYWMAPEVANRKRVGYGFPSDIWSLGCTATEMSTRKYPQYNARNAVSLDRAIRSGKGPIVPDYLTETLKDFINQCLQPDPNQRPTAADLLAHPFVNESFCPQPDLTELLLLF
ncbi:hypothetical protein DKX38_026515 [Salix brachista]|uniref:Protein kinase domain-containing protein n=1 Tax=Salix brachista TaxID=2182728 RepID=A0A5N5JLG1_9ROSI|nr:hypothetical protein DKX38_026515 [Salix brachista]